MGYKHNIFEFEWESPPKHLVYSPLRRGDTPLKDVPFQQHEPPLEDGQQDKKARIRGRRLHHKDDFTLLRTICEYKKDVWICAPRYQCVCVRECKGSSGSKICVSATCATWFLSHANKRVPNGEGFDFEGVKSGTESVFNTGKVRRIPPDCILIKKCALNSRIRAIWFYKFF